MEGRGGRLDLGSLVPDTGGMGPSPLRTDPGVGAQKDLPLRPPPRPRRLMPLPLPRA